MKQAIEEVVVAVAILIVLVVAVTIGIISMTNEDGSQVHNEQEYVPPPPVVVPGLGPVVVG